jgi:CRISPR/Cas system CMR-associated protein Cmr1 (group 7 of RAMP superfamily)
MASACWILFGGLGMRTRRGFGSLELKEGQSPDLRRIAALVTQQPKFSGGMYSLLGARIFVGSEAASAKKAWQEAVEQYRDIKLKRKLPTHTNSRLASPVITKAVQDKGRWKPLILVLANSKSGLAEAYASELRSAPYKELRGT